LIEINGLEGNRNVPGAVCEGVSDQIQVIKMGGSVLFSAESMDLAVSTFFEGYCSNVRYIIVNSALRGVTDLIYKLIERSGTAESALIMGELRARHLSLLKSPEITKILLDMDQDLKALETSGETLIQDRILSYGEKLSARILSKKLSEKGLDVREIDPTDLIKLDINGNPDTDAIKESVEKLIELSDSRILIVPGFYGSDPDGNIRVLGRGGSDLTAALLSNAADSTSLDLWKDVDGIYTADPSFIRNAARFSRISVDLAERMMSLRAKIIHPLALKYVNMDKCRITVRGIGQSSATGTEIVKENTDGFFLIVVNEFTEFVDSRDFSPDHFSTMENLEKFIASENDDLWVYSGIVRNSVIVLHPGNSHYGSVLPSEFDRVTTTTSRDYAVIALVNEDSFRDEFFDSIVTDLYNKFRKEGIKEMAFRNRSRILVVRREILPKIATEIHSRSVEAMI
jgi:aspartate kinase